MRNVIVSVVFIAACAAMASSQTKTITNSDLAAYREKRIAAERELREDYARLGFPSPEVRAAREAQAAKELTELSTRLRNERLDRERREAEIRLAVRSLQPTQTQVVVSNGVPIYYYYYPNYGWRYNTRSREYVQPGYFAGGMFIPTGSRTPMRPVFVRPRN